MSVKLVSVLTAIIMTSLVAQAAAAGLERLTKPLYHEPSGSYFQLVENYAQKDGINWAEARQQAARLSHEGRRGRLAVIDNSAKHNFVRKNFNPRRETWIGLRYWCSTRMLAWDGGQVHSRGGFEIWMPKWHRTNITCSSNNRIAFMPVYYDVRNWRWQASGQQKHFPFFIVEYPPDGGAEETAGRSD